MDPILTLYILTIGFFLFRLFNTRYRSETSVTSLPLDWVGRKYEPFSKLRAFVRQHTGNLQLMMDGYNKVITTSKTEYGVLMTCMTVQQKGSSLHHSYSSISRDSDGTARADPLASRSEG